MNLQPVARWTNKGTILHDGERLFYRSDSKPEEVEPWPQPGATVREKIKRMFACDIPSDPLVPTPGLGEEVYAEVKAESAERARRLAAEHARIGAEREAEVARRQVLQEKVAPYLKGWKRGTVQVSLNDPRIKGEPAAKQEVPCSLSPIGPFALHRPISTPMAGGPAPAPAGWVLTHIPSGYACARFDNQQSLRILAVRLGLASAGYEEAAKGPTEAVLARWATIAVPFRRAGDPWCPEDPAVKKVEKAVKAGARKRR